MQMHNSQQSANMNKQQVYEFLKSKKIWYEKIEHKAVFNMKEISKIKIPYPECEAKNLFVRDDKKNYYLITIKGHKKVDFKKFRTKNKTRHLSFATKQELIDILNLSEGAVTPLGLLNDETLKVKFYLDKDFYNSNQIIGIHPNDNTATIWIKVEDLISIIKEHGNIINIVEL